ncbi:MAG: metallopeptidase TldD-related protein, partial [Candidatus Cloacimonadaceae bacterium]
MKDQFEKIAAYVKKHVKADDYNLRISARDSHETRFAQNAITQHIAGANIDIDLEVAFDNKTGRCSINQTDETALAKLIKSAEDMALLNQPDPEYVESAKKQDYPQVQNASEATLKLAPEQMVDIIKKSIANGEARQATVSGMTEKHYVEVFNSAKNGFEGYYDMTEFGHSMTMKKDHIETKVSFSSKDFATFNPDQDIAQLNEQFTSLGNQQSFEACKIPVILRPAALMEFFWFMMWMMNRRQADEGMTAFTDQLGKQFMGEKFSLLSTLTVPELIVRPYSWDSVVAEETFWVRNGVVENMPTPRYWAKLKNLKASSPFNVYMPGGDATEEEMLKLVPKGLIINRFWYIRPVDMKAGELTGMTRDGVLYFENGKIQHAVNNLRFNEIPHDVT